MMYCNRNFPSHLWENFSYQHVNFCLNHQVIFGLPFVFYTVHCKRVRFRFFEFRYIFQLCLLLVQWDVYAVSRTVRVKERKVQNLSKWILCLYIRAAVVIWFLIVSLRFWSNKILNFSLNVECSLSIGPFDVCLLMVVWWYSILCILQNSLNTAELDSLPLSVVILSGKPWWEAKCLILLSIVVAFPSDKW